MVSNAGSGAATCVTTHCRPPSGCRGGSTADGAAQAFSCATVKTATVDASNGDPESDSGSVAVDYNAIAMTKTTDAQSMSAGDTIRPLTTVTNVGAGAAHGGTVLVPCRRRPYSWSIAACSSAGEAISAGVLPRVGDRARPRRCTSPRARRREADRRHRHRHDDQLQLRPGPGRRPEQLRRDRVDQEGGRGHGFRGRDDCFVITMTSVAVGAGAGAACQRRSTPSRRPRPPPVRGSTTPRRRRGPKTAPPGPGHSHGQLRRDRVDHDRGSRNGSLAAIPSASRHRDQRRSPSTRAATLCPPPHALGVPRR